MATRFFPEGMRWVVFRLSLEGVRHNRTIYLQRTACALLSGLWELALWSS